MKSPGYRDSLAIATEIMTALFSEPDQEFAVQRLNELRHARGAQGIADACIGFANLTALALAGLAQEKGVSELELLQRLATIAQSADEGN